MAEVHLKTAMSLAVSSLFNVIPSRYSTYEIRADYRYNTLFFGNDQLTFTPIESLLSIPSVN